MKKTQVDGKKYLLPEEEIEIEKLIKRGLSLQAKVKQAQDDLEAVKVRLTEISRGRRAAGATSVKLAGISGGAVVTFRESWEAGGDVEDLGQDLGAMFPRFFEREVRFRTTKELAEFIEGRNGFGFADPDAVRELVERFVKRKTIKPNVRIVEGQ